MNWQPIETAPMDKEVMLWIPEQTRGHVTFQGLGVRLGFASMYVGCSGARATHWMPFQAPPEYQNYAPSP